MTESRVSRLLAQIVSDLSVEEPVARRVLVLSPHPDDDVIGCGGTLAKHIDSGGEVAVVYLTDGRKGDPTGKYTEHKLVELRESEARAACKILGIRSLFFLGRPDGELRADRDTVDAISAIINDAKPEIVYLPFFFDGFFHSDHLQANVILDKIVAEGCYNFTCYGYETYTPLIPNKLVDISSHASAKMSAIKKHKTQIRIRPFSKILQLNEYRAAILGPPKSRYVEAFLRTDLVKYFELFRNFFNQSMSYY